MTNNLSVPGVGGRKFSIPASLLAVPSNESTNSGVGLSARRRLSNVSDLVSRRLSTTIVSLGGWNRGHWPPQGAEPHEIVEQGKSLCSQYIRARLKRCGLLTRKLALQRLRSVLGTPSGAVVRQAFPVLLGLGVELERLHPRLYSNVSRQTSYRGVLSVACLAGAPDYSDVNGENHSLLRNGGPRGCSRGTRGGPGGSQTVAPALVLAAVARGLFKHGISWAKIVSLYCVCGGLAVDCVRQGRPEALTSLLDATGDVIEEEELQVWIARQGGWTGLNSRYQQTRPDDEEVNTIRDFLTISLAIVAIIGLVYVSIKTCFVYISFHFG